MAEIKIQDTGKLSVGDSSAQESDKANSGSEIDLKGVEINMEMEQLMNTDPAIGLTVGGSTDTMYTWPHIDVTGIDRRKWIVRGVLDATGGTDMTTFSQLCSLVRTKGYKLLKPFSGNPLHTGGGILAYCHESGAPLSSINVRVKSFTATATSEKSTVNYELQLMEDLED